MSDEQTIIGENQYPPQDASTLPATEHDAITGRSAPVAYILTEFPEPPRPNPRSEAHRQSMQIDGEALRLNNATLRYETSSNYSDKYREQIIREIREQLAKISQYIYNIAEVIRACELADELSVEHVIGAGRQ